MSKVVSLVKPAVKPDVDIIEVCRGMLKMAEAGELQGIAVSMSLSENGGTTATALAFADNVNIAAVVLGLRMVSRRVEDACLATQE